MSDQRRARASHAPNSPQSNRISRRPDRPLRRSRALPRISARFAPRAQIVALAGLLIWTAGCTLGPDPKRPHTIADEIESYVGAEQVAESVSQPLTPWWQVFGDPITQDLVSQALEHNTDLKAAAARVMESKQIRHIPVMSGASLRGLVSRSDILATRVAHGVSAVGAAVSPVSG